MDLRVTVVGDELFAAAIHSQESEYPSTSGWTWATRGSRLPTCQRTSLEDVDLMGRLGIVYGAIDLRRMPDGRHVFLEINPAGQWLFVEAVTGQPIAAALARLLLAHDGVA